ncbi:MAG: CDP-alcohol phosphatidyltransferase family protein [Chitinivibrionales bacterium]|nr:CDP-alcohol phosphatidyltransferase family protein [Chitinivibrionales bacterium]
MGLTLANRITLARILIVPIFIAAVVYHSVNYNHGEPTQNLRLLTIVLFIVTFIFDAVDGYIARTRNQITRLGTLLDPLADKAMLLSGLVLLSGPCAESFNARLPIWFVIVVISRDVVLIFGAAIVHFIAGNVVVRPRISGKLTTFFLIVVIGWVLVGLNRTALDWLVDIATATALISATQYIFDGIRQLENHKL